MSLRQTIEQNKPEPAGAAGAALDRATALIKSRVHNEILKQVDLRSMETMAPDRLRGELKQLAERLLDEDHAAVNELERRQIVESIQNDMLGLGPLEPLLADATISDILVNGPGSVYVERRGRLQRTEVRFDSEQHLMRIIDKIVARIGRRVDESSPMVDARLSDGSRVNAIIAPLALHGPVLSIRRFAVVPYTMQDLLRFGTLTQEMADLVTGLVKGKVNLLISGGTGSGKTTLLNVLSGAIPPAERIVTIEDAA